VWSKEEKKEPVALLNGVDQQHSNQWRRLHAGRASQASGLYPRYIFDTFVVGNSNRLAHAACQAVAEKPAAQYNPCVLYAALAWARHTCGTPLVMLQPFNGLQVLYVSSEEFTNELINAFVPRTLRPSATSIAHRRAASRRHQFIAGKESTQEEFFHTFTRCMAMASRS